MTQNGGQHERARGTSTARRGNHCGHVALHDWHAQGEAGSRANRGVGSGPRAADPQVHPAVAAGIAKARSSIPGPGPAFPILLGDFPSCVGYAPLRGTALDMLPDPSDIRAISRARTRAGSTSRPGGPFQPVARRGFDMPTIGASVPRRRRFACGSEGFEAVAALERTKGQRDTMASDTASWLRLMARMGPTAHARPVRAAEVGCDLPLGAPSPGLPQPQSLRRSAPRQGGRA
jgi:hypothetical protein